jgi:tetratricopeptide (TPR) repeat protein
VRAGAAAAPGDDLRRAAEAWRAGDLRAALAFARRAARARPDDPEARQVLARCLAAAGDGPAAVAAAEGAVALAPRLAGPHVTLAEILAAAGRQDAAVGAFRRAAALAGDDPRILHDLACLLAETGGAEEAAGLFARVLARRASAPVLANLGNALKEAGRLDEAATAFGRALALDPRHGAALVGLGTVELRRGRPEAALAAFDACLANGPNTRAVAYKHSALAAEGRREEARAILDLRRHVSASALAFDPALWSEVAREIEADPTLAWEPSGKTTRAGAQTGRLGAATGPAVGRLLGAVGAHVDRHLAGLSPDPAHPHFAALPDGWDLHAWATVLGEGGHQLGHIHASAFLSGVVYVQLPAEIGGESTDGWIELGRPGYGLPVADDPEVRLVRPEVGLVVLFPGYCFHRTVPFRSATRRISVAFDVVAKGWRRE